MAIETDISPNSALAAQLDGLGIDFSSLDPRTQNQLADVYKAIQTIVERRQFYEEEARTIKLTVSSVADASGISRATIYNKKALKSYVEQRIASEKTVTETLREENRQLRKTVEKLKARDGELLLARIEIEQLKTRISALEKSARRKTSDTPVFKLIANPDKKQGK